MRVLPKVLITLFLSTLCISAQQSEKLWQMNFEKLADGVYAAYHSDPLYLVEGNVLFIINDNDVVVFDGSGAQPIARNIINKIKELTDNPVSYLIISHGHEDHIRGLQEYVHEYPDIEIIARPDTRTYMDSIVRDRIASFEERQSKNEQKYTNEIAEYEESGKYDAEVIDWYKFTYFTAIPAQRKLYKTLELQLPTMTFEGNELTLIRGSREIRILYLGYGKTQSDLLLYLPNEKVLATGDIVTAPVPYGFSKQPDSWLDVLKEINGVDAEIIVPGHGTIMHDKKYIQDEIEMISYVNNKVEILARAGKSLEDIKNTLDVSEFENKLTNGDSLAEFLFNGYYFEPHVENRFNQIKNN